MEIKKTILGLTTMFFALFAFAQTKPNVIIILADDLGFADVGFNNHQTFYLTPTLDSLAKKSAVLSSFYSMPTCSPTRASLMTGCYPSRHGIYTVDAFSGTPEKMRMLTGGRSKKQLDAGTFLMPQLFKSAGYQTALIGKWHLGEAALLYNDQPVFDEIIGRAVGQEGHPDEYYLPTKNISFKRDDEAPLYLTDRLTYETKKYIKAKSRQQQPFFLYLAHYAPHVPLHARKEDAVLFQERQPFGLQNRPSYAAMVYSIDRSVKEIIQQLKELNQLNNTIIIFTSDNGGQLMSTGNAPLSGQKGELKEGGIRVPFFIWYNGLKPQRITSPACVVDLLPTLAEYIQQPLPSNTAIDGKSIKPLLNGSKDDERSIFFHFPGYTGNGSSNAFVWQSPAGAIRKGKWKLVESLETGLVALYNLEIDVAELKDVSKQNPATVKELQALLKAWQKTSGALISYEKNVNYDPASRKWIINADTRKENDNTNIKIE